jgi:hypothetical protein
MASRRTLIHGVSELDFLIELLSHNLNIANILKDLPRWKKSSVYANIVWLSYAKFVD